MNLSQIIFIPIILRRGILRRASCKNSVYIFYLKWPSLFLLFTRRLVYDKISGSEFIFKLLLSRICVNFCIIFQFFRALSSEIVSEFCVNVHQLPLDENDDELADAEDPSSEPPLGFELKNCGWYLYPEFLHGKMRENIYEISSRNFFIRRWWWSSIISYRSYSLRLNIRIKTIPRHWWRIL